MERHAMSATRDAPPGVYISTYRHNHSKTCPESGNNSKEPTSRSATGSADGASPAKKPKNTPNKSAAPKDPRKTTPAKGATEKKPNKGKTDKQLSI